MKKLSTSLFILSFSTVFAQWSLTGNSNTTASSVLGTLSTAPTNAQDLKFIRGGTNIGILTANKVAFGINCSAANNSVSLGLNTGAFASGTGSNVYIGMNSGKGFDMLERNSGAYNVFVGTNSGLSNSSGSYNTYLGQQTGESNRSGANNTFLGALSGNTTLGNNNVFLGYKSGFNMTGANNVLIGTEAGTNQNLDNKLYIENTSTTNPLIWGDFSADQLKLNGKVGIGGNSITGFGNFPTSAGSVNVSNYNLFVKGGILTEEVRVNLSTAWADYVFNPNYKLKPLNELEDYIIRNNHLPNVPSAEEVKKNGIELGEIAKIQQEKIEELTLYIIELNKKIELQQKQIETLLNQSK